VSYRVARGSTGSDLMQAAPLTIALIAINVVVYALQAGSSDTVVQMVSGTTGGTLPVQGSIDGHYGLWGPMVSSGEWWRLVTSGFLHANVLHIGRALEPALGSLRLGVIYFVSLAAGSLGVLILEPDALSIGASGAIFGLMGAFVMFARSRGISVMQSGIGPVILLNLAITFTIPGISIGGHLGGLAGGAAIAALLVEVDRNRRFRGDARWALVGVGVAAFVALLVVAFAIARSKYPLV
jgi:membrane associated rhomboid family serine protease